MIPGTIWHAVLPEVALELLGSSSDGLDTTVVKQRQLSLGKNDLPREHAPRWTQLLIRQFQSPLIVILLLAAFVSVALGDYFDASVILAAVLLNTAIGFVQEYQANHTLEQLRTLVSPLVLVRRAGLEMICQTVELVPGDIVLLRTGDHVPADARVIESSGLELVESALTGESTPTAKQKKAIIGDVTLADRSNMVWAGTHVASGTGTVVIVATGAQTEVGKIALSIRRQDEPLTPLQAELGKLGVFLSWMILAIVVVLFSFGLVGGRDVAEMFALSVSLAVAAIPEGLVVSVTIVLTLGMRRILKRRALVRRLIAAETLGSVSVICTDKTGTITQGEMRVMSIITVDGVVNIEESKTWKSSLSNLVWQISALCNDASFVHDENGGEQVHGSPTEQALLIAAREHLEGFADVDSAFPREASIPFDSSYKWMATLHATDQASQLFVKGAPERLLALCCSVMSENGSVPITESVRLRLLNDAEMLAKSGMRLVALAYASRARSQSTLTRDDVHDLTFVGMVAMRDPLRPEVREQILASRHAGVRTVLVTGDHRATAMAIAHEAGLLFADDRVVTGEVLDKWSDAQLRDRVNDIDIYARVEPHHKLRIIDAWHARGATVAMTGDGVNDAPALTAADIGVALGSGVDVAKQASDLVLLDNNLGTITAAIEEGRVLFDNIRKVTVYLLADSFTEIILISGAVLLGLPTPLLPLQILWINLVADSFPNLGLAFEPKEREVMDEPPRLRHEPVLNRNAFILIFIVGIITDLALFGLYFWLLRQGIDLPEIQTIIYTAVGIDSLLYVFAIRSLRRSVFRMNPFGNPHLLIGVLLGFGFLFLPFAYSGSREVFHLTSLDLSLWWVLLIMGLMKLVAIEIVKEIYIFAHETSSRLSHAR